MARSGRAPRAGGSAIARNAGPGAPVDASRGPCCSRGVPRSDDHHGSIGGPGLRGGWLELARAELAWLRRAITRAPPASWTGSSSSRACGPSTLRRGAPAREARLGHPQSVEPRPRHLDPELDRALGSEIAAEQADVSARATAWGVAAEAWASVGRPYDEGWARLRQAEAGFAGRDHSPARVALGEATQIADELGATLLTQAADDLARPVRGSPPDRSAVPRQIPRRSPNTNGTCWRCSPRDARTATSRSACSSAPRRWRSTSRDCSTSSAPGPGGKPSRTPGARA